MKEPPSYFIIPTSYFSMIAIAPLDPTPIGRLWLAQRADGVLLAIHFGGTAETFAAHLAQQTGLPVAEDPAALEPAAAQLRQYFAHQRQQFNLPLAWDIFTPFQAQVLRLVTAVPYGQHTTYAELAKQVGGPEKARAVGRANATNPLPILIPCHRVLGADGRLHGYAGGLETKATLLRLEGSWLL